ncbi:uncharacterized protein LOC143179636 [Calliopsis andreniformis]|uniref:uncharacterized protein LOC143179636 n=1 Tax=Calliopsis andreniformis TaxID=337506 RepID=UPI003FCC4309
MKQTKKKAAFKTVVAHETVRKRNKTAISTTFTKQTTRSSKQRLLNKLKIKKPIKNTVQNSDFSVTEEQSKQKQFIFSDDYKYKASERLPQELFNGVIPKSTSSIKMNKLMPLSTSIRRSNRKSGPGRIIVKKVDSKNYIPLNNETKDINNLGENSIDAMSSKLFPDDNETFNLFNNFNNKKKSNTSNYKAEEEEENETFCNDTSETLSSTSNNTSSILHSDSSCSEPVFFSPYIVTSRGKSNARKEILQRSFNLGHSVNNDIPTKDTIMKNLNVSVVEEEHTAQYFQFLLNKEIDKLNELCEKWENIKNDLKITKDIEHQINHAIGQTNLLICKKFERFHGLVSDCEKGKGEMLVTCKDLQGFWDMMYMEVKNCYLRFDKLEKLHLQNWKNEEGLSVKPVGKKKTKEKKSQKLKDSAWNKGSFTNKKFMPMKYKGLQSNRVQLIEKKKMNSPITTTKISKMCKTPEILLDNSISYVNSDQTPGKSILKQSQNSTKVNSHIKSTHKVKINDHVCSGEIPVNEEMQVKHYLAAALTRIDSLDFDEPTDEVPVNLGKKLTFDDSSFEESKDMNNVQQDSELTNLENKCTIEILSTKIENATQNENTSPRRSLRRQDAVNKIEDSSNKGSSDEKNANEYMPNIRVLRNRSITSENAFTPRRSSRRSENVKELKHKENKTPLTIRRKSSPKVNIKNNKEINQKINLERIISNISINKNNTKRRRSTRNVKSFGDNVCEKNKTVLPITSKVMQNKIQLSEKERRSISKQELASSRSPKKH